jgi:hypothetical protein
LCQKYHKLPSQILEEDAYWINILLSINSIDAEMIDLEEKRVKLREMAKNGSRY